jgi:phosphosulfolactate synthase
LLHQITAWKESCHEKEEEIMKKSTTRAMEGVYPMPIEGREDPPRSRGLTMVIDMGNGVGATKDLLELADRYIDIIKISSGSIALYEETVLRKKIEIIKNKGIKI